MWIPVERKELKVEEVNKKVPIQRGKEDGNKMGVQKRMSLGREGEDIYIMDVKLQKSSRIT